MFRTTAGTGHVKQLLIAIITNKQINKTNKKNNKLLLIIIIININNNNNN